MVCFVRFSVWFVGLGSVLGLAVVSLCWLCCGFPGFSDFGWVV